MIKDILPSTDEILQQPIDGKVDLEKLDEIKPIIETMIETKKHSYALGLAANQIGYNLPIFIYETARHEIQVVINPVVIAKSGQFTSHAEGCLSVGQARYNVKRYRTFIVKGYDHEGCEIRIKPRSKRIATVIQHEMDHLNGVTLDRNPRAIKVEEG